VQPPASLASCTAETGTSFFRSLARCAAQALGARYAFAAETLSELESRSLAYWEGADFGEMVRRKESLKKRIAQLNSRKG
jgi:hypothetical protein